MCRKRTSALAGFLLVLVLAPVSQASAASKPRGEAPRASVSWIEASWAELSNLWGTLRRGSLLKAETPKPPPPVMTTNTCESCSDIGRGIDPNG